MQFLLDNLAASLIGMTVFMIMVLVNHSNREALTDSTAFYAMIRQQEEFGQILTRDMQGVEELLTVAEASGSFSFRGYIGDEPTRHTITYQREQVRVQDGVPYYRIKRLVDGEPDGGSADVITEWTIEGRDPYGSAAGAPESAAQIHIRFEAGSLLGERAEVEQSYWEASFFPPLLQ